MQKKLERIWGEQEKEKKNYVRSLFDQQKKNFSKEVYHYHSLSP